MNNNVTDIFQALKNLEGRCLFFLINIVKKLFGYPKLGDAKIQNIVYQLVVKYAFFE